MVFGMYQSDRFAEPISSRRVEDNPVGISRYVLGDADEDDLVCEGESPKHGRWHRRRLHEFRCRYLEALDHSPWAWRMGAVGVTEIEVGDGQLLVEYLVRVGLESEET
jgi:hypothetical protein